MFLGLAFYEERLTAHRSSTFSAEAEEAAPDHESGKLEAHQCGTVERNCTHRNEIMRLIPTCVTESDYVNRDRSLYEADSSGYAW